MQTLLHRSRVYERRVYLVIITDFQEKNKSLYNSVCKQWNFGTCSFGDRCNRWHVCWTCAEAGKVGEAHRASSHDKSSTGSRQGDQRS